ncbi:MAG: deoxynucleoside kinase [Anaerolineae bacterium]
MSKHLVLVAGNIGAGKTSLTERLGQRLAWHTAYESVADNPYLPDFYDDMKAWGFHLQIFFLGHRARQHERLSKLTTSAIVDRSIYEDAHIFARALHELGNMSTRDYEAYQNLYKLVVSKLPRPDLLIYIKTSVPTLRRRIAQRGRAMETSITDDYLALLDRYYEEWIAAFDICPVLTVPGDELDFVRYPEHLEIISERVLARLAGKEAVQFPKPEVPNGR